MSFLRAAGGQSMEQSQMAANLAMAEREMEMMGDMFHRLSQLCHAKCISPRYLEEHLSKGESVCTDRCVAKFFDVSAMVGKMLSDRGEAMAAAAAAMPQQ
ncbi:protein transporter tim10 [Allomyces arbusculus]|nr:protein transporter tim10 [Allomyces arbusculus]